MTFFPALPLLATNPGDATVCTAVVFCRFRSLRVSLKDNTERRSCDLLHKKTTTFYSCHFTNARVFSCFLLNFLFSSYLDFE